MFLYCHESVLWRQSGGRGDRAEGHVWWGSKVCQRWPWPPLLLCFGPVLWVLPCTSPSEGRREHREYWLVGDCMWDVERQPRGCKEVQASGQTELVSAGVCRRARAPRYQTRQLVCALLPLCVHMHTAYFARDVSALEWGLRAARKNTKRRSKRPDSWLVPRPFQNHPPPHTREPPGSREGAHTFPLLLLY